MKISEVEEKLAEIRSEFGDANAECPDPLEPGWRVQLVGVEYDHDRETVVFTVD